MDDLRPTSRERRLAGAILVLATVVLFFIAVGLIADALAYFADILLAFFLAWLLAFIISPVVTRIAADIPGLPRVIATVMVYTIIAIVLIVLGLIIAQGLANSITSFVSSIPDIRNRLPEIVAPVQGWLDSIGLGQVDVVVQISSVLDNVDDLAAALVAPLQSSAVASVGAIGTGLIIFFLSIYMVVDRDQIMAFLFRLVPPGAAEEARLLQTSVARSFGGFLRGQALMGIVYFAVALGTSLLLGLPLAILTSTLSGVLQAIPFFGPFLSWAPPVIVALLFKPDAVVVRDEDARPAGVLRDGARRRAQRPRATTGGATGQRLAAFLVHVTPLGPGALAGHVGDVGAGRDRARRRCRWLPVGRLVAHRGVSPGSGGSVAIETSVTGGVSRSSSASSTSLA